MRVQGQMENIKVEAVVTLHEEACAARVRLWEEGENGGVFPIAEGRGFAKKHPSDPSNPVLGRNIALMRAFHEITEFLADRNAEGVQLNTEPPNSRGLIFEVLGGPAPTSY